MTVPGPFPRLYPSSESERCIGTGDRSRLLHFIKEAEVAHSSRRSTRAGKTISGTAIGTTTLSLLMPLVFTSPVLSSTVTIDTTNSLLTVNAQTTSGGSDYDELLGVIFPNPSATSRADAAYSVDARGGVQSFPFYSEAVHNYGGSTLRTEFSQRVVTSYVDPYPQPGDFPYSHHNSTSANGVVEFLVGPLGASAEISGAFSIPIFRQDSSGGDRAQNSFESDYFVSLFDVTAGVYVVDPSEYSTSGNISFSRNLILAVGHTYRFEYGSLAGIVEGEQTYYDVSGFAQLQFLTQGGPLPIPLPTSALAGMGLFALASMRRPSRL